MRTALLIAATCAIFCCHGLKKVVIPAVYKEWSQGAPAWLHDTAIHEKYNFSTFVYQKLNSSAPNYIAINRGTEGAVYLRYIVDHYDSLPDIMIFLHGRPEDHQPHWLEMVGCIHPNASYININFQNACRTTSNWAPIEVWVEQCWRDVLKIVWGLENDTAALNRLVPTSGPILICFTLAQQFVISRSQVRKRPLEVWKKLLKIIGEQPACHLGEPDYNNLFASLKHPDTQRLGPEPSSLLAWKDLPNKGYGAHTQGGAMEHLAHVIFGHYNLDMDYPSPDYICSNFLANCHLSPCVKR